jgi:hypothetical protein
MRNCPAQYSSIIARHDAPDRTPHPVCRGIGLPGTVLVSICAGSERANEQRAATEPDKDGDRDNRHSDPFRIRWAPATPDSPAWPVVTFLLPDRASNSIFYGVLTACLPSLTASCHPCRALVVSEGSILICEALETPERSSAQARMAA